MLTKNQFQVLYKLYRNNIQTQRQISSETGLSLGVVNEAIHTMTNMGYLEGYRLTSKGTAELDYYKVDNAIIMAAGLSSRFAPLSYEKPKGLLSVKGEVLIERQIRQLREAGIENIIVVVGYMKEEFFYLEEKYHVKLIINAEYSKRNNNSTLYLVRKYLANTYICSSDNYFVDNVFASHVYQSYYSAVYQEGETDEYCLKTGRKDRIDHVTIGGRDSWIMLGHVYFSKDFSKKFVKILEQVYLLPETKNMLWEDIYIEHIDELDMYIQKYDAQRILEFDSLDDLRTFDSKYINNADSKILGNICKILKCHEQNIINFIPIKKGLTNTSFLFTCNGQKYIYRHPGAGTQEIINRKSEAFSMSVAQKLNLDDTYIYMSPKEGWKISRYIENAADMDYRNDADVHSALKLLRTLHDGGITSEFKFNVYSEIKKMVQIVLKEKGHSINGFDELYELINTLYKFVEKDGLPKKLCHNDCFDRNFLKSGDKMFLIDWEYSGNADPAGDLGTFICCSDYTFDEAIKILQIYFGRPMTDLEYRHYIAYIAISSFYWYVWALYKESKGETIGEYLYIWYRYANSYGKTALESYKPYINFIK
ncbi:MAG TPA: NTP transferase domain-containing protein [Caproicibacter sp.]|nr:NTP transferase domain-containing protein [Caproicibacter sp.]